VVIRPGLAEHFRGFVHWETVRSAALAAAVEVHETCGSNAIDAEKI
jgi:hypothetical protein